MPENKTLVIEEADLRDSGVYKVLASNDEGVAEYAFTVIVGKSSFCANRVNRTIKSSVN